MDGNEGQQGQGEAVVQTQVEAGNEPYFPDLKRVVHEMSRSRSAGNDESSFALHSCWLMRVGAVMSLGGGCGRTVDVR